MTLYSFFICWLILNELFVLAVFRIALASRFPESGSASRGGRNGKPDEVLGPRGAGSRRVIAGRDEPARASRAEDLKRSSETKPDPAAVKVTGR